jgi:hypothetical protein
MKFLLMIKPDKNAEAGLPPDPKLMAAIGNLVGEMVQTGKLVDTGGITPLSRTTKLKVARGKVAVTDGPFTEARELIGGYAIVKVDSREEALDLAKRFMSLHAEFLGPDYENEAEVLQLYDMSEDGRPK